MNNLLTIPVFWQKVKVARKQLKMPQREVAEAVGVKQGQVSKMESGNQKHVQIALIKPMLKYGVNLNAMCLTGFHRAGKAFTPVLIFSLRLPK